MAFPNRWRRTIDIKVALHDDSLTLREKADAIAGLLGSDAAFKDQECLEDLRAAGSDDDVEWFDYALSDIYDIADAERVWLGA